MSSVIMRRELLRNAKMPRPGLGRFWNSFSFLHEARATLAVRSKYIQHGGCACRKSNPDILMA
jgi:hypothetical protein